MLKSPEALRKRFDKLSWQRDQLTEKAARHALRLSELDEKLEVAGEVSAALEELSNELFEEVLGLMEVKLTQAIEEVLDQPVQFKALTSPATSSFSSSSLSRSACRAAFSVS